MGHDQSLFFSILHHRWRDGRVFVVIDSYNKDGFYNCNNLNVLSNSLVTIRESSNCYFDFVNNSSSGIDIRITKGIDRGRNILNKRLMRVSIQSETYTEISTQDPNLLRILLVAVAALINCHVNCILHPDNRWQQQHIV